MPISIGTYTCKTCNENFEAKSDKYYACPCGASEIKPTDTFHSMYSYKHENTVEVVDGNTYYIPDEFIQLSEKAQTAYDEIKRIHAETGYKYMLHEYTVKGENGETFLKKVDVSINQTQQHSRSAYNALKLHLNLEKSRRADTQDIEKRLELYLSFMKQIEDETLDISQTFKMSELSEELGLDQSREQVDEYDYTFYV